MNIEKITIEGKDYVPFQEFKYKSCLGCDLYKGACSINKLCKCIGEGLIFKREGSEKPVAGEYNTIQSYEDACLAIGSVPVCYTDNLRKSESDLAKEHLEVIAMSFRKQDVWPGEYDKEGCTYYVPCFKLFTAEEIRQEPEHVCQSALWVTTHSGDLKLLSCSGYTSISFTNIVDRNRIPLINHGFFLQSEEATLHFASRHFIQIWATYLGFEYTESDYYIK